MQCSRTLPRETSHATACSTSSCDGMSLIDVAELEREKGRQGSPRLYVYLHLYILYLTRGSARFSPLSRHASRHKSQKTFKFRAREILHHESWKKIPRESLAERDWGLAFGLC